MRTLLLALLLVAACGKKQAPKAPAANAAPAESAPAGDPTGAKNADSDKDEDDAKKSESRSDPCDGGQ